MADPHLSPQYQVQYMSVTSALVVKEGVEGGPSSLTTVPSTVYVSDQHASSQGECGGRSLLSHHSTRYSIQMGGGAEGMREEDDRRASSQGGGRGRTLLSHHSTRYSICQ